MADDELTKEGDLSWQELWGGFTHDYVEYMTGCQQRSQIIIVHNSLKRQRTLKSWTFNPAHLSFGDVPSLHSVAWRFLAPAHLIQMYGLLTWRWADHWNQVRWASQTSKTCTGPPARCLIRYKFFLLHYPGIQLTIMDNSNKSWSHGAKRRMKNQKASFNDLSKLKG